jgi:hypothetical protein
MSRTLSVVMPVHNEAAYLAATIEALTAAIGSSNFRAEIVLVDDGSTDGSAEVARAAVGNRLPFRVLSTPHEGRFRARGAGVESATAEWVLLLDARIRLHPGSLSFVDEHIGPSSSVWNGHVIPQARGNPFGAFGNVLVHIAWAKYFDNPRMTSYDIEEFDHFPKGTGCFLAPKTLLLESIEAFSPRVSDLRLVSDDTHLIRWIAARHRIHLSPEFGCDYQPRTSLGAFLGNAVYRGSTFLDGHGRRESRFYPVAMAFYPLSAGLSVLAARQPRLVPLLGVVVAGAGAAVAVRAKRPASEVISFAALTPVYGVAHGAGMWRALAVLARERFARRLKT